jgi:hypothetical protein
MLGVWRYGGRVDRIAPIAAAVLAGCACPELLDAPVQDPDGIAAPGQVAGMRAAMADFMAWTGGPGVCVPSVRITNDVDLEGALGRWDGAGRPLRVAGDHALAYGTVVHELCHAWDEGRGHESGWHTDAFPEDSVSDRETYDTPQLRVREAFARTCEAGPVDLRLREDLAERCGLDTRDLGEHWVAREVYGVSVAPAVPEGLAPQRVSLDATLGTLRVLDAVAGAGRVWVLAMRPRPFHPLQPARIYHVVLGLDPETGALQSSTMLRRDPEARRRFRLIGGEPGPLLAEEGPDELLLSALGGDGRPGPPLVLAAGVARWDGAARVGGTVWMSGVDDVADDGVAVLDLESGDVRAAPLDPPLPGYRTVFGQVSWTPSGEVLVGGFTERLGAGLLRIDPETGTWAAQALPDGAEAGRVGGLPDGRAAVPTALWAGEHKVRLLAALDEDGGLGVSSGCEADRLADGVRFLPMADGLWLYEDATDPDGVPHGRYLTRVGP